MARKIEIDLAKVESLAAQGLTQDQIADALGISERTLHSRKAESAEFAAAIKRGKAKGIGVISNALFQNAKSGNVAAQIFFLKARAGWTDKTELTGKDGGPVDHSIKVSFE